MERTSKLGIVFSTLTGRLILSAFLIHAILIPILFFGVVYILQQGYQTLFVNQVRSEAYLFARLITHYIPDSLAEARSIMDDALLSGHMVFVEIHHDDQYKASNGIKLGNHPPGFLEDFYFGQHDDGIYFIAVPIFSDDEKKIGMLRIGYSEATAREQINSAYQQGILVMICYVIIALVLAVITSFQLTNPLKRLGRQSRLIAAGEFEATLEVGSSIHEVASLASDLNNMRRELVQQAHTLEYQALHDSLTGLPNRIFVRDRVTSNITRAERENTKFALLVMDLDHFKEINDTLGHPIGDIVLQLVAAKLRNFVAEHDCVARLGGDEFCILLDGTDGDGAKEIADRIGNGLQKPFRIDECTIDLGASIGIAVWPDDGYDFEVLLRRADVAMYVAKRDNSRFTRYSKELDPNSPEQLSLTGELREALDNNEMILSYQPKYDIKTQVLAGVEALVRWQHPRRGYMMPNSFVALAERTGMIEPLTIWVVTEALRQAKVWKAQGINIPVAVNISARNLLSPSFPENIQSLLSQFDLDGSAITLELTESALLADPLRAQASLIKLHGLGIHLAIDDFGTGYSSLAYLKKLPVNELKIDKMFINDMTRNPNDMAIVRATIEMAHSLELIVVAEGIEDHQTLIALRNLGCDLGQGNLLSQPVSSEAIVRLAMNPSEAFTLTN